MTFPFQPIISHYNFEKLSIFLRSAVVLNNFKLTLVVFFSFVTFSKWFQIAMNWKRRKVFAFFWMPRIQSINMQHLHLRDLSHVSCSYHVLIMDVWIVLIIRGSHRCLSHRHVVCRNYIHSLFFYFSLSKPKKSLVMHSTSTRDIYVAFVFLPLTMSLTILCLQLSTVYWP